MAADARHLAHHHHRAGRGRHLVDRREVDRGNLAADSLSVLCLPRFSLS